MHQEPSSFRRGGDQIRQSEEVALGALGTQRGSVREAGTGEAVVAPVLGRLGSGRRGGRWEPRNPTLRPPDKEAPARSPTSQLSSELLARQPEQRPRDPAHP